MAIDVTCEGCGKTLSVDDSMAGKRGKCPKCGTVLVVPDDGPVRAEVAAPEPKAPADSVCPNCSRKLGRGDVFCIGCGTDLKSGKRLKGV